MTLRRASLALPVLLLATLAHAKPIFISGFDGTDNTTSNTDSYEFTENLAGGAADADVNLTTARVHDDADGGSSSSRHALLSQPATGKSAWYSMVSDLNPGDNSVTLGVSVNVESPPSAERTIAAITMPGGTAGCYATVDANRQISLYFNSSANSWGTTTTSNGALKKNACSSNPQQACTTGTVTSDCASGDTCSLFYWAGIEITQNVQTANIVICELYIDGVPVFTGTAKTIGGGIVAKMANVAIGVSNLGAGTTGGATVYYDDLVIDDGGQRAGFGYVAAKYPNTTGLTTSWNTETCKPSPGATVVQCVDDYDEATNSYVYYPTNDQEDNLKTGNSNKVEEFSGTRPTVTLRTGESASAVEILAFGRTNTTNATRKLTTSIMVCPTGVCQDSSGVQCAGAATCTCTNPGADGLSCTSTTGDNACCVKSDSPVTTITTSSQVTSPKLWMRYLTTVPPVPGVGAWTDLVNQLGMRIKSGPTETQSTRIGALLEYIRVRKADSKDSITLRDHNKGTDDGLISIAFFGDSTLAGTLSIQCQGGTSPGVNCGQASYCSWDDAQRDKPSGGCGDPAVALDNTLCQTCANRRGDFGSGAGYACTADADCALGTCTSSGCDNGLANCCTGDSSVSCTVNGDCALGTCATTATCVASCPGGGVCPTDRAGWAGNIPALVPADVLLKCGQGSEDTGGVLQGRFDRIVEGKGENVSFFGNTSNCSALAGTGKCTCSTDADCGGGASSCASGLCVSGSANQAKCTSQSACAAGMFCQFPPPDYIVGIEGYNDHFSTTLFEGGGGGEDPQCSGLGGSDAKWCPQIVASPSGYQCGQTACTQASDCSGTGAECDGRLIGATGRCVQSGFGTTCTLQTSYCATAADCGAGMTCDGVISPGLATGVCRCTADAQCPASYACVGASGKKLCRHTCTVDADCAPDATCDTSTFSPTKVCKGRCNCPCDRISCTKDGDCGGTLLTQRTSGLRSRFLQGRCNLDSGTCANCGQSTCATTAGGPCSCATNGDCGGGGVCDGTRKVCTAGDALKLACRGDLDCGTHRCMSTWPQFLQWRRGHQGLAVQVYRTMQGRVDALNEGTSAPVLLFGGLPTAGGMTSGGILNTDASCSAFNADREYNESIGPELLALFPARHIIDFRSSEYERNRTRLGYHADFVHFSALGSASISQIVADKLNALNVCLKTDGVTPQRYCRKPNGAWADTGCGNPTTCPLTCTTTTDCGGAGNCVRRKCDADGTNCPDATDSCGAD